MTRVSQNCDANLKKTLVEWFWGVIAQVRLMDLHQILKPVCHMKMLCTNEIALLENVFHTFLKTVQTDF